MMKKLIELYNDERNPRKLPETNSDNVDDFGNSDKDYVTEHLNDIDALIEEISKMMIHDPELRPKFMEARKHFAQAFEIIESAYV